MGWQFSDGNKIANGRRIACTGARNYLSSDQNTVYTVKDWADGTSSCNCPGWARRVDKRTGERTCAHVRGERPVQEIIISRPLSPAQRQQLGGVKIAPESTPPLKKPARRMSLDDEEV